MFNGFRFLKFDCSVLRIPFGVLRILFFIKKVPNFFLYLVKKNSLSDG